MAQSVPEVWETTLEGVKYYGTCGPRDVLIIVSSESLEGPDIVPRKKGELTKDDVDTLIREGLPPGVWHDDIKIMKARYIKDSTRYECVSIDCDPYLKKGDVCKKISTFFSTTTKPGVIIHYIGPGRRHTGDWCFKDGFITFADLTHLYIQHFTGKTLTIHSDCSYSGQWVQACKEFLDKVGTQPCGRSARKTGMLLKVFTSCQTDQVGSSMLYSARGYKNGENDILIVLKGTEISPDQKTCGIDFTKITCKKSLDEECALSPDFTFHKLRETDRIHIVRGTDRGRKCWHYVLLRDDSETKRLFLEKVKEGNVDVADYGLVLKSGWGEDPPKEVLDWMDKISMGIVKDCC